MKGTPSTSSALSAPQQQFRREFESVGSSQAAPPRHQSHTDSWRWSLESPAKPAGSPVKTFKNEMGRIPPPSNVDFRILSTDITEPIRRGMTISQSMPTMGVVKERNEQEHDMYKKIERSFLPEPRHGRRRCAGLTAHHNSTIHA